MKKIIYLIIFILMIGNVHGIGIGISPSELNFKNSLKGTSYEKEFTIHNTQENLVDIAIEVDDYKEWFSFYPDDNFKIRPGEKIKGKVRIDVPKDTKNGFYNSTINVKGKLSDSGGIGLIPSIGLKVNIHVTDKKIIEGYVDTILSRNSNTESNAQFLIGFMNKGNVKIQPRANIIIKKTNREIDKIEKTFDEVNPEESKRLEVEYHAKEKGSYIADISVYLDDKLIKQKEVSFRVTQETFKNNAITKNAVKKTDNRESNHLVGLSIVLIILVIGLILLYFLFIKK